MKHKTIEQKTNQANRTFDLSSTNARSCLLSVYTLVLRSDPFLYCAGLPRIILSS